MCNFYHFQMHIDLAEYNIVKSADMKISEAARTFAELREAVSNEGAWADTTIPASELIPWLDRLANTILKKGLDMLEPVLAVVTAPEQEKQEEQVSHVAEPVLNPNALISQHAQSLRNLHHEMDEIVDFENPGQSEKECAVQPAAAPQLQKSQIYEADAPDAPVTSKDKTQPAATPFQLQPHPKTSAAKSDELAARERELKIREKALQLKEEAFERYVAEFDQKLNHFESKYSELNRRVTDVDNTEDMSYFEETLKNMDRRLKKIVSGLFSTII